MSVRVMMITMRLAFMFWLIVCTNMYMLNCKRRNAFVLRFALVTVVQLALSVLVGWGGLEIMLALLRNGTYTALISSIVNLTVHYILYALSIGGLFICYRERPVTIIFGSIAGYATNNIAIVLNNAFGAFLPQAKMFTPDDVTASGVILWLFCNAGVPAACYFLFARTVNDAFGTAEINSRSTLVLFAVIVVVSVTVRSFASYYGAESTILFVFMCICLICCNAVILYVQFLLSKKTNERKELEKIIILDETKKRQYELTKETIDIINMKCHDLRHQILLLKKNREAEEYIDDLGEQLSIYGAYAHTGNDALDVVLTDKNLQCGAKGISLTAIADGELLSFMKQSDVYSLFGNALENAVEYVSKLPPDNRIIKLFVEKAWDRFVSIRIWNSYEGAPPEMREGLPVSDKGDLRLHGYGVKSMKKITESYGGDFTVSVTDGCFAVNILIPVDGKHKPDTKNA